MQTADEILQKIKNFDLDSEIFAWSFTIPPDLTFINTSIKDEYNTRQVIQAYTLLNWFNGDPNSNIITFPFYEDAINNLEENEIFGEGLKTKIWNIQYVGYDSKTRRRSFTDRFLLIFDRIISYFKNEELDLREIQRWRPEK